MTRRSIRRPHRGRARRRAGDARRESRGLGRGRGTIRGLVRRGGRADPLRRDQPVRCRDRAHRRPPRPLPAGDPPPVRRRARHALALEPGCRRGRRCRLQPAHARARGAPDVPPPARLRAGSRPMSSRRRPSSTARPTSCTPAAARSSGSRTSTPGPPSSPASSPRPVDSSCSRGIRRSGCSTSTTTAAGSRPTTTTSVAPRRRRAGRPSTSTGCRSPRPTRAWKFARAWTLGEVITALLGADLRLEARRRAPGRLVGRPRRRPRRRTRPDPVVVLGGGAQGAAEPWRPEPCSERREAVEPALVVASDRVDRRRSRARAIVP